MPVIRSVHVRRHLRHHQVGVHPVELGCWACRERRQARMSVISAALRQGLSLHRWLAQLQEDVFTLNRLFCRYWPPCPPRRRRWRRRGSRSGSCAGSPVRRGARAITGAGRYAGARHSVRPSRKRPAAAVRCSQTRATIPTMPPTTDGITSVTSASGLVMATNPRTARTGRCRPPDPPPPRDLPTTIARSAIVTYMPSSSMVLSFSPILGRSFSAPGSAVNDAPPTAMMGEACGRTKAATRFATPIATAAARNPARPPGQQSPAAPLSRAVARRGRGRTRHLPRGRVVVVVIVAGREERAGRTSRRLLPLGGLLPLSRPLPLVIPGRTLLWGACCQAREATVTVGVAVPWPVAGPRVLIRRVLIGRVLIGLVTLRVLVRRMAVLVLGERRVARRMPVTRRVLVTHTPIDGARPPPRSEIALTVSTR